MLDSLYENIGTKIKGWAKAIFVVEAVAAIISGIVLLVDEAVLVGILTMVVGPFIAWVSSWLLYGFGELIEKTVCNEENTRGILQKMEASNRESDSTPAHSTQTAPTAKSEETHLWRCEGCGQMIAEYPCRHCGHALAAKEADTQVTHELEEDGSSWLCGKCGKRNLTSRDSCWSCGTSKQA